MLAYRKSTHTDRYLNFSSHHPLQQRLGVGRSLLDRKDSIVTEEPDRKQEEEHIKKALRNNGYKDWAIQKLIKQQNDKNNKKKTTKKKTSEHKPANRNIIVLPYMQGTTERLTKLFRSHNISTAVKPAKTLRRQLVHMKDKIDKDNTCDCVYEIPCKNCDQKYIGTTGRPLRVRLKEHKKDVEDNQKRNFTRSARKSSLTELNKSAVTDHVNRFNHEIDWENTRVLTKESNENIRLYKEAIAIRREPHVMNRDEGARDLPHSYDILVLHPDNRATRDQRSGAPTGWRNV